MCLQMRMLVAVVVVVAEVVVAAVGNFREGGSHTH